jgi:hypothetical protein
MIFVREVPATRLNLAQSEHGPDCHNRRFMNSTLRIFGSHLPNIIQENHTLTCKVVVPSTVSVGAWVLSHDRVVH